MAELRIAFEDAVDRVRAATQGAVDRVRTAIQSAGAALRQRRTELRAHRGRLLAVELIVTAVCLTVVAWSVRSSGRLGLTAPLVIVFGVALIAPLESRIAWRRVSVLAALALAVAYLASLVQDIYVGGPDGRTYAAAIIAVVLPVTAGLADRWSTLLRWLLRLGPKDPGAQHSSGAAPNGAPTPTPTPARAPVPVRHDRLRTRHRVVAVLLCLVFSCVLLARQEWLPGVTNDCYTPPGDSGMTVLVQDGDGSCYGLIDSSRPGLFARDAFGTNPQTRQLETRLLAANTPLGKADLTVIWLGSLTCTPPPNDVVSCAGKDYPAERDQLRGLLLAQAWIGEHTSYHLHVVIADATQDVRHADDVAALIVRHRAAFGARMAVVGGGDSRSVTLEAILRLLRAQIPFIAPNLLADPGDQGTPFVNAPGYFQLPPPNIEYARDTVHRLATRFPRGFRLTVYQVPAATDLYTTSLVNDLFFAVDELRGTPSGTGTYSVRHSDDLAQIDHSVCDDDPGRPPGVLFFADRWTRFADFLQRVDQLCGQSAPREVIADGSVSRFMADLSQRVSSTTMWPLDYYVGGPGCADLSPDDATFFTHLVNTTLRPAEPYRCAGLTVAPTPRSGVTAVTYCTLEASQSVSQPCAPTDLGNSLLPAWDSVMLADRMLRSAPRVHGHLDLAALTLPICRLTAGTAQVRAGQLVEPALPVELWHVDRISDPHSLIAIANTEHTPPHVNPCWA